MSPLGRCGLGFQQLQQEMLCTFLAKSGYCTALKKSLLDRIISCYQTAIVEVNLVLVCYPSQKCLFCIFYGTEMKQKLSRCNKSVFYYVNWRLVAQVFAVCRENLITFISCKYCPSAYNTSILFLRILSIPFSF